MSELSEAPVDQAPEAESDKRRLALFGLAGVVVLGLLAWLLLGQGSDEDLSTGIPVKKRIVPVAAAPSAKPATSLPPVSRANLGRDPFKALVSEPVAAPVVEGPKIVTPGTNESPTAGPTAKPGATTAPQPTTYSLRLSRIDGSGSALTARFVLGKSTIQYARVGSRFGRTAEIKLLSLQSDGNGRGTAVIQVGESPFDVSTGDPAIFVQ